MRLLTHNQLVCIRLGCNQQYPLTIIPTKVEQTESEEVNIQFLLRILPNIEYTVLTQVAKQVNRNSSIHHI